MGIKHQINTSFPDVTVEIAYSSEELINCCEKSVYDLIIVDIETQLKADFNFVKKIKSLQRKSKLFVFTNLSSSEFKYNCSCSGVDFILQKNCSLTHFIAAFKLAFNSDYFLKNKIKLNVPNSKSRRKPLSQKSIVESLSHREHQVAILITQGYSNTMISEELGLAMTTVSTYKKRILEKSRTKNSIELSRILNFTGRQ